MPDIDPDRTEGLSPVDADKLPEIKKIVEKHGIAFAERMGLYVSEDGRYFHDARSELSAEIEDA